MGDVARKPPTRTQWIFVGLFAFAVFSFFGFLFWATRKDESRPPPHQQISEEQFRELVRLREASDKEDRLVACQNAAHKLRSLGDYLEADIQSAIANCARQGR
jgi:hypothetical protein